ncbi:hypothetical protein L6258_00605 [Candidatus Parcubacteria bacterium]|nr:hypothetical protein [Candidatus Parcubacteria bacterium]
MMYPKLRFALNQKLDYEMGLVFLNSPSVAGRKTAEVAIIALHQELGGLENLDDPQDRQRLEDYINSFYTENDNQLKKAVSQAEKLWPGIEGDFFAGVDHLFHGHPWPPGEYIGYPSIFSINPRFPEDKTFQFYAFDRDNIRHVIVHEMLHFIFFDYAQKKYPDIYGGLSVNEGPLWTLSEVFNTIILNQPPFAELIRPAQDKPYPGHRRLFKMLKDFWEKGGGNINVFLEGALNLRPTFPTDTTIVT